MKNSNEILGCFVSITTNAELDQEKRNIAFEKGRVFRSYIWGDNGICEQLKCLKYTAYGKDLKLILLQFYINPESDLKRNLNEIERYRRKEKSIGIPIIVEDENFFSKSDIGRYKFLKEIIIYKLNFLFKVISNHKLDTDFHLLKADLENIFE